MKTVNQLARLQHNRILTKVLLSWTLALMIVMFFINDTQHDLIVSEIIVLASAFVTWVFNLKYDCSDVKIVCSAIYVDRVEGNVTVIGVRHSDCISELKKLGIKAHLHYNVQGFMTNYNKFVDREEAMEIAKKSGQTLIGKLGKELYSENLY